MTACGSSSASSSRPPRQERDLSLAALSKRAGLAVSYLSEIEKGKKYPKPEKLLSLCNALGLAYDELVSLEVDQKLDPLADLLDSDFMREFPFELFGIEPREILDLFRDAPEHARAFLQTFLVITSSYDVSVESFLLAALRTYQQMRRNFVPELEREAESTRKGNPAWGPRPTSDELGDLLVREHGYRIDDSRLGGDPTLQEFRSVFRGGDDPTVYLNPRLNEAQRCFALARELGFCVLGHQNARPSTSSWVKVGSFDELVNNFQASYYAGALLLPRAELKPDIASVLQQPAWSEAAMLDLLQRHGVTPEMLLHRLSQLLPGEFGLDRLFYMRFTRDRERGEILLTKELDLTERLSPYGPGTAEHHCRRWLPMQQLVDAGRGRTKRTVAGLQRVQFGAEGAPFAMISLCRPMQLAAKAHSAMLLGIELDRRSRSRAPVLHDSSAEVTEVWETCERCPVAPDDCDVRAAPPTLHGARAAQRRREDALAAFLDTD